MSFRPPWISISEYPAGHGDALVRGAIVEIPSNHPLSGRALTPLARREDCDDVLFQLDDGPAVAVVHLTWSGRPERPGFPTTRQYSGFAHFRTSADAFGND